MSYLEAAVVDLAVFAAHLLAGSVGGFKQEFP